MLPKAILRGFFRARARSLARRGAPRLFCVATSRDPQGQIVASGIMHNMVVGAGLDKILDAVFKMALSAPAWFVGLKSAGPVAADDVMDDHPGWAELGAAVYSESTRQPFVPGAIEAHALDNAASLAVFHTITATTIHGLFLCDDDEVGGSGGTLYCAGDMNPAVPVVMGGTFEALAELSFEA